MNLKTYILFTSNFSKATEELERAAGEVVIHLTDKVFLANIPETINPEQFTFASPRPPVELDLISNLMAEVWARRNPKEMQILLGRTLRRGVPEVTSIQNADQIG